MDIVFIIVFILTLLIIISNFSSGAKAVRERTPKGIKEKKQKELIKEKQKAWIEDDLIYDPKTGAKITLEQAQSGVWDLPSEEEKAKHKEEQKASLNEAGIEAGYLFELLKTKGYKAKKLNDEQIDFLEQSALLTQYDNWGYTDCYILNDETVVFSPYVKLERLHYEESQLMVWVKVNNASGHYFMEPKNTSNKLLGSLVNKEDIKIKNYSVHTIKKGFDITNTKKILQKFSNEKGLQVELNNNNLLIKTLVQPNRKDFERIEKLL
ncbi:hypothetical protein [Flavobacterium sp.]|uniref:hypothetical protein n=1 Tax=Flavobacterium sp. TaxID=239 RepID=UPI003A8F0E76